MSGTDGEPRGPEESGPFPPDSSGSDQERAAEAQVAGHRPDRRKRPRRAHRRFRDRYESARRERAQAGSHPVRRGIRISGGIALLALSPFVGIIPGPGGLLVLFGGLYLLASENRRIADWLDRGEQEASPRLRGARARWAAWRQRRRG